ncbi:MAG: hypothetical protein JO235_09560, partial [Chroococcidiopsidaceae cyanobacterium CP_BM_RX_35]|nr:hypothetical protein [Chroococcidiopsidaceae cyanobacterium CP_BM_RX_35]
MTLFFSTAKSGSSLCQRLSALKLGRAVRKFLHTRLFTTIISFLVFIAIVWVFCSQGALAVALIKNSNAQLVSLDGESKSNLVGNDFVLTLTNETPPSPLSAFWSEDYHCKKNLFKAEDVQGPFDYRGCNAVRFYPIPSQSGSYFQRFGYNLKKHDDDCSFQQWGIRISHLKATPVIAPAPQERKLNSEVMPPLFEPGSVVFAPPPEGVPFSRGKFKVDSGYDQSAVIFNKEVWVAFECYGNAEGKGGSVGFGTGFDRVKSDSVAACVAPYNPKAQRIDYSRGTIPILGGSYKAGDAFGYSASVPKLLVHKERLFLYWSSAKFVRRTLKWQQVSVRGIELEQESDGFKRLWVKGYLGKEIMANDPSTWEVWSPGHQSNDNSLADVFQLISDGNYVYALGAIGGQGCLGPTDVVEGCYQFSISRSHSALGNGIFARNKISRFPLRNSSSYTFLDSSFSKVPGIFGSFDAVKVKQGDPSSLLSGIYRVRLRKTFSPPKVKSWEEDFLETLTQDLFGRKPTIAEVKTFIFPTSQIAPSPKTIVESLLSDPDNVELAVFHRFYEMLFLHPSSQATKSKRKHWRMELESHGPKGLFLSLLTSKDLQQVKRKQAITLPNELNEKQIAQVVVNDSFQKFLHRP